MSKELLYTFLTFLTVQSAVWFQTNGQFIWTWFKDHPFILSLFGIPISLGYIWATKFAFAAFDGTLWPGRLIGFAMGIISFQNNNRNINPTDKVLTEYLRTT